MQINIIDVGGLNTHQGKTGRDYQSLEVTYKGPDGRVANKKLMSFSNPQVFKAAQTWTKGDVVDVLTEKDTAGYWQWTGIGTEGGGSSAPAQSSGIPSKGQQPATRVTGSNYETSEERAERQRLIVRQSSLSNAVSILTVGAKTIDKQLVLDLANELTDFVFNKKAEPIPDISNIEDDIPY